MSDVPKILTVLLLKPPQNVLFWNVKILEKRSINTCQCSTSWQSNVSVKKILRIATPCSLWMYPACSEGSSFSIAPYVHKLIHML